MTLTESSSRCRFACRSRSFVISFDNFCACCWSRIQRPLSSEFFSHFCTFLARYYSYGKTCKGQHFHTYCLVKSISDAAQSPAYLHRRHHLKKCFFSFEKMSEKVLKGKNLLESSDDVMSGIIAFEDLFFFFSHSGSGTSSKSTVSASNQS